MDEIIVCPVCHVSLRPIDYFCFNCGKNIHPRPLSTSAVTQAGLYIKSLLLPPLGIIWGIRYIRQSGVASKVVGLVAVVITIAELVWLIQTTVYTVDTVNQQINQQVQLYGL